MSAPLHAGWIEPGDKISLNSDEGLALFVVDSDGSLTNIRIDMIGAIFTAPMLKKLEIGRSLRLLKLAQGEYQFDQAQLVFGFNSLLWDVKDLPNRRFKIEAGKLNYVGDLKVSGQLYWREMSVRNGGLRAFDELERLFPGLANQYVWRYTGEYPDPFIEFYKTQLAEHPEPKNLDDPEIVRPSVAQRDLAGLLFRKETVSQVQLSPSGRHVLEYRQEGNVFNVYLTDLKTSSRRILVSAPRALQSADWLDENLLALTYFKDGTLKSSVIKIAEAGPLESVEIAAPGNLFQVSEDGSKRVIFARTGKGNAGLELFAFTLSSLDQARKLDTKILVKNSRIRSEVKNDYRWWFDADGVPRLAQCQADEKIHFEYFATAQSNAVKFSLDENKSNPNDVFEFVGFDLSGKLLIVSNRSRAQAELVEFEKPLFRVKQFILKMPVPTPTALCSHLAPKTLALTTFTMV